MALITRPLKIGGNTTYVAEVAGGNTIIRANEVDDDLGTIITDYNGNVTEANLADNAVTSAKLAPLAVTSAKIAVNATMHGITFGAFAAGTYTGPLTNQVICTMVPLTTRGGRVLLFGAGTMTYNVTSVAADFIMRLKRGSTVLLTQTFSFQAAGSAQCLVALPTPMFVDSPAAGTYTYTIEVDNPASVLYVGNASSGANPGIYWGIELS